MGTLISALVVIAALWFIVRFCIKAWNNADVDAKVNELEETEENFAKVQKAKSKHKGIKKKKKAVKKFRK
jgi:beta-lactam-binding protein with PASTA domain